MKEQKWIQRWNTWIAPRASKPGVFRRKEGGFLIRGRAVDLRTGKLKEVRFVAQTQDALEAFMLLQEELRKVRAGEAQSAPPMMTFSTFAPSSSTTRSRAATSGRLPAG